jgi:hypothetical protein
MSEEEDPWGSLELDGKMLFVCCRFTPDTKLKGNKERKMLEKDDQEGCKPKKG